MPRANRYCVSGATDHLNRRYHDRKSLPRLAVDRDPDRPVLWETKPFNDVCVLAYCLTSDPMQLLLRADDLQTASVPGCSKRTRATLDRFGSPDLSTIRGHYEAPGQERIERGRTAREPRWTETVAVGDGAFVRQVESRIRWRQRFECAESSPGVWSLRESGAVPLTGEENA